MQRVPQPDPVQYVTHGAAGDAPGRPLAGADRAVQRVGLFECGDKAHAAAAFRHRPGQTRVNEALPGSCWSLDPTGEALTCVTAITDQAPWLNHPEAGRGDVDLGRPPAWQQAAAAFAAAVADGRLDLPRPGAGQTRQRWAALAGLAAEDLSLARLAEGHADAVAILAELDGPPPPPGSRWGVWAAQPPGPGLTASHAARGWRLTGTKRYCSGARVCTHALVTAATPDGVRLFALTTGDLAPGPGQLAGHRHGRERHARRRVR